MAKKPIKSASQRANVKKTLLVAVDPQVGFVRTEPAPLLPTAVRGWLYRLAL